MINGELSYPLAFFLESVHVSFHVNTIIKPPVVTGATAIAILRTPLEKAIRSHNRHKNHPNIPILVFINKRIITSFAASI
jgi:hypothetical protein